MDVFLLSYGMSWHNLFRHSCQTRPMKALLVIPLLLISLCTMARRQVLVERGHVTTAPGVGGYAQIGYAFAKGDMISIDASAEKLLERMIVMIYPQEEVGRDLGTKTPKFSFTMPYEGIVIFRFISDRGGTNRVDYTVTRMPASDVLQHYNTKVVWDKPPGGLHGRLVPRRAGH